MISKVVSAAAVAALIFAAAPASAMKMASCNQKNMDKTDAMLMKMPDGENKNEWDAGNDFGKILNVAKRHGRMSRSHEQGHEDGNDEVQENVKPKGPAAEPALLFGTVLRNHNVTSQ